MVSFIPEKLAETVGIFPALPVGADFGVTRAAFFCGYRGKGFRGYPLLFFSRLPGVLVARCSVFFCDHRIHGLLLLHI